MKRVTVICEALVQDRVTRVLKELGAHGHTVFHVQGSGNQGERSADIQESANVQIDAIVPPPLAETILLRLQDDFFPRFAMIAYESDVRVLRAGKF